MFLEFFREYSRSLADQVDPGRPLVPGKFDEDALQREEDRHPERQGIIGKERGIALELRPVFPGAHLHRGRAIVRIGVKRLVVDDPAATVGDENAVDDMVDRNRRAILDAASRPCLFGAGHVMLRKDPASGRRSDGPAEGGDDQFCPFPGLL